MQRTHRIEHTEHHHAHVGKDSHTHRSNTYRGKEKDERLDDNGKDHILTRIGDRSTRNTNGLGYLRGLIVHQHDVGSVNSSIGAHGAHGYSYICACQHWGIVDTIADKSEGAFFL